MTIYNLTEFIPLFKSVFQLGGHAWVSCERMACIISEGFHYNIL